MSEWRAETSRDLDDAAKRLGRLAQEVSGDPTKEQLSSIWRAYLNVEKSIAFIRFDMDEENPGRTINLRRYLVPDERQALNFSLRSLNRGADAFNNGDFLLALSHLRESRNYLRALLREKRLKRFRTAGG